MRAFLIVFWSLISFSNHANQIEISDTGITFDVPEEFGTYSQELLDLKWPNKSAPAWVMGNESTGTTIAYDLKPNNISKVPLDQLKDYFSQSFERMLPGLEWKKKEVIELSGKQWVLLEMTSNAIDTDIYNIMLITSYGEKMLMFNFNSTKEEFEHYESQLRRSMSSIKLPEIAP